MICICPLISSKAILVSAEVAEEPAPACPAPNLNDSDWRSVELVRIGIRLNMPKKYAEKHWAVTTGNPIVATFRAGHLEEFTFEVDGPGGRSLSENKVMRQKNYEGYTECTEMIRGHQAVIQAYREPDVIFTGEWHPAFTVAAVCDLRPGRILRFHGTAPNRQTQEELLSILRTLEFTR